MSVAVGVGRLRPSATRVCEAAREPRSLPGAPPPEVERLAAEGCDTIVRLAFEGAHAARLGLDERGRVGVEGVVGAELQDQCRRQLRAVDASGDRVELVVDRVPGDRVALDHLVAAGAQRRLGLLLGGVSRIDQVGLDPDISHHTPRVILGGAHVLERPLLLV